MSRLFRAIATLSLCITWLSFACYAGVGGVYRQGDRQPLNHGELLPASVQRHNSMGIDTSEFGMVGELIGVTPEPLSLAVFGSGLTLTGVVLLRSSRRTKPSTRRRNANFAAGKSRPHFVPYANGVQYSRGDTPATGRFVTTYMSSGSK